MIKISELIKYEGDNSTFIWKHPSEDFNSLTQLVVHESQEAIFMMNGQALDVFGPGRYTLETQNIPLIGNALKRLTGDVSPFHCEVYFVNKTEQMAIKWGTDSKVQFMEPTYQFPIQIGASGEMSLRADDSVKLALKLVGTERELNRETLVQYFRAFLMSKIKPYLVRIIKDKSISIFEIDEYLAEMSHDLHVMLQPDFEEYGISLEKFFVTTIVKPDGDSTYEKFKLLHFRQYADVAEAKLRQQVSVIDQQTEAQKMIIESQALVKKRAMEGYTYQQEKSFEVAEKMAENEASGQFANMGIGLGVMSGVGGTLGGFVGNSINEAIKPRTVSENTESPSVSKLCPKCGKPLISGAKFCMECGEKISEIPDGMVLCPNCKNIVVAGKFCLECGTKL